jgi:hypothetical protein
MRFYLSPAKGYVSVNAGKWVQLSI